MHTPNRCDQSPHIISNRIPGSFRLLSRISPEAVTRRWQHIIHEHQTQNTSSIFFKMDSNQIQRRAQRILFLWAGHARFVWAKFKFAIFVNNKTWTLAKRMNTGLRSTPILVHHNLHSPGMLNIKKRSSIKRKHTIWSWVYRLTEGFANIFAF